MSMPRAARTCRKILLHNFVKVRPFELSAHTMVPGVIAKDFMSAKNEGFCCGPAHVTRGSDSEDSRRMICLFPNSCPFSTSDKYLVI